MHGESGLSEVVEEYLSRPLRLYVYNHEYAITRIVNITPSRSWGGDGALGCVLGFGALHRLPLPLTEPPAGPGDTLFETARFSNEEGRPSSASTFLPAQSYPSGSGPYQSPPIQASSEFLIPATMVAPPPPPANPSSPAPLRSARKQRHVVSPNRAFDEYFQEGEKKSREEDFAPAAKAAPPPPPPKSGSAPPKTENSELRSANNTDKH